MNVNGSFKRLVVLLADAIFCLIALNVALILRFDQVVHLSQMNPVLPIGSVVLCLILSLVFKTDRSVIRKHNLWADPTLKKMLAVYSAFYISIFVLIGVPNVSRTVGLMQPFLFIIIALSSRYVWSLAASRLDSPLIRSANVSKFKGYIWGVTEESRVIKALLEVHRSVSATSYIDPELVFCGRSIDGLTVISPDDLIRLNVGMENAYIFTVPASELSKKDVKTLSQLESTGFNIKEIPNIIGSSPVPTLDLSGNNAIGLSQVVDRQERLSDLALVSDMIKDQTIFITGGGGSIGGEIVRQVSSYNPKKIIILELSEFNLYKISEWIRDKELAFSYHAILGSCEDKKLVNQVMFDHRPDIVFHAAAYKHVDLVELNAAQAFKNNVLGTAVVAKASLLHDVKKFVLISTDKAVRPTGLMGATKRLAELYIQALQPESDKTTLCIVRFGNVVNSSGSVIPKFIRQIEGGGPVTVTHPEVSRFFMSIPEASQLVILASAMSSGGEVFLLEMGELVKIRDVAERLISLAGLSVKSDKNPEGDIEIQYTGLRQGEKLFEEKLIDSEAFPTESEQILVANEKFLPMKELSQRLEKLNQLIHILPEQDKRLKTEIFRSIEV